MNNTTQILNTLNSINDIKYQLLDTQIKAVLIALDYELYLDKDAKLEKFKTILNFYNNNTNYDLSNLFSLIVKVLDFIPKQTTLRLLLINLKEILYRLITNKVYLSN